MDMNKQSSREPAMVPFDEAILKAKVAQICDSVGYHAMTQDSSNILVDIYRRTIHHLARHCKDAANNNRRVEPTLIDLIQAYDFVGINIPDLQEYIETVKLPKLNVELTRDEQQKPVNGIQRNLLVDDLLEAEKNTQSDEQDDGENKVSNEATREEEEEKAPSVPLLKDTYEELANKFADCTPVVADKKIRLGGRILVLPSTKLKITTPILPEPIAATSSSTNVSILLDEKSSKKKKRKSNEIKIKLEQGIDISNKNSSIKIKKKRKLDEPKTLDSVIETLDTEKKSKGRGRKKRKLDDVKVEAPIEEVVKKKGRGRKKLKTATNVTPLDPAIAEPPSFLPILEEEEKVEDFVKLESESKPSDVEKKSKGRGRKKLKHAVAVMPLDPAIAEPPSFLPILEDNKVVEEAIPDVIETNVRLLTPAPAPTPTLIPTTTKKDSGSKKKKKKSSSNQFAIVTERVTEAEKDDKEWFCPGCGLADDGDWVQCDTCQDWYHLKCTDLKKAPEDDENWECVKCSNKAKAKSHKKAQAPLEVLKIKTPEPIIKVPSLPPTPTPPPQIPTQSSAPPLPSGVSQDDLCPECNLPDNGTLMIQCDDPFCARWFHGKCVNLLEEPKEDESWFCKACVEKQQSAFKRRRRAK